MFTLLLYFISFARFGSVQLPHILRFTFHIHFPFCKSSHIFSSFSTFSDDSSNINLNLSSSFCRKKAELNMEGQFLIRQIYDDEITYNLIGAAVEILSKCERMSGSEGETERGRDTQHHSTKLYMLINLGAQLDIIPFRMKFNHRKSNKIRSI